MYSVQILQIRIYDRVVPLQDIVGYTIDNPLYTLSRVTTERDWGDIGRDLKG